MHSLTLSLLALALQTPLVLSHSPNAYYFNPLTHLAGIAPPFDPLDPQTDPAPPQGCTVSRASYLIRHAAIFANDFDYEEYIEPFVAKLSNTTVRWSTIPTLSFLSTWRSPISSAEQEMLTRSGKLEAMSLGVDLAQRYQGLRTPGKIWSSTAERTVKSANSLMQGIADDASNITLVQVSESEESGADSLTPYSSCPAYSSSAGNDQSSVRAHHPYMPLCIRTAAAASTDPPHRNSKTSTHGPSASASTPLRRPSTSRLTTYTQCTSSAATRR